MYDLAVADINGYMAVIADQVAGARLGKRGDRNAAGTLGRVVMRQGHAEVGVNSLGEAGAVTAVGQALAAPYIGIADELHGISDDRFAGEGLVIDLLGFGLLGGGSVRCHLGLGDHADGRRRAGLAACCQSLRLRENVLRPHGVRLGILQSLVRRIISGLYDLHGITCRIGCFNCRVFSGDIAFPVCGGNFDPVAVFLYNLDFIAVVHAGYDIIIGACAFTDPEISCAGADPCDLFPGQLCK